MYYPLNDPSVLEIGATANNGTQLMLSMILGVIDAWLSMIADRGWPLWYLATFFFLFIAHWRKQ